MNKKTIYIGLGAVVAYLLYKKFVAKSETKTTEAEAVEESTAEEAPTGGGGGGGGTSAGAEAAAQVAAPPAPVNKSMTSTKLGNIKPSSVMSGITAVKKPRNFGTAQRPTTPLKPIASRPRIAPVPNQTIARPRIAPAPNQRIAKFAGFMDFDANKDVLGGMM
jgi:hypothetical protein